VTRKKCDNASEACKRLNTHLLRGYCSKIENVAAFWNSKTLTNNFSSLTDWYWLKTTIGFSRTIPSRYLHLWHVWHSIKNYWSVVRPTASSKLFLVLLTANNYAVTPDVAGPGKDEVSTNKLGCLMESQTPSKTLASNTTDFPEFLFTIHLQSNRTIPFVG